MHSVSFKANGTNSEKMGSVLDLALSECPSWEESAKSRTDPIFFPFLFFREGCQPFLLQGSLILKCHTEWRSDALSFSILQAIKLKSKAKSITCDIP